MKKLSVTYDTMELENGTPITGETCYTIEFADEGVADRLLEKGSAGVAVGLIEKLLFSVEFFKGRHYIPGSIKHYELAE